MLFGVVAAAVQEVSPTWHLLGHNGPAGDSWWYVLVTPTPVTLIAVASIAALAAFLWRRRIKPIPLYALLALPIGAIGALLPSFLLHGT
ncbi:hypothetical protein CLV40_1139 [Actinokineospora auranticolor]|uniref:Uncharacterized protein n=1 Tax=Actinokineospora auranticolor TaxID=155976 RepID=A0A2S6GK46_9PSEU|nr:hypothetical protein CLV40_1139 [Actinokineospora auranticolor]